jgi:lipopolysaccharide/colanic/teichoic acid biosynthesis glycosyltransferase
LIYSDLVAAATRNLCQQGEVRTLLPAPARIAARDDNNATRELAAELSPYSLNGSGALALRQPSLARLLDALKLDLFATWDELVQPFMAQAHSTLRAETPYYDPTFWVNRLPYQSAQTRRVYRRIKRTMDLAAVLLTLPLTLPLGLVLAGLIWLEDRASPIYVQQRVGLGGRKFKMYKFRSMIPNADQRMAELGVRVNERGETVDEQGNKLENDPRITRLGKILRKTSLDELPQLWNVLVGDMSLVGPRPTSFGVDKYSLLQTQRLSVKPGITGLWQIYDRGDTDFDKRLIWDIKYIEKMSLTLDLIILLRTVLKFRQGAR